MGTNDIAIIGLAGRFPKANSIEEFWNNLLDDKDCITRKDKLVSKQKDHEIINAYGSIDKPFHFDNDFFDISEKEALSIEPQERLALQCVYQALEDAGINLDNYEGKVGIVCGAPENEYCLEDRYFNKNNNPFLVETDKFSGSGSALTGRISYRLNLNGPSVIVNTTCATSLTAIHIASNMLRNNEANIMLAGGANVSINQENYIAMEGLVSKEGIVRPFDKNSSGLVPANGVGIVVLKRLNDAINDNDNIYAVIKGSAIGNDGNRKIGFTAPSVLGEYDVIKCALDNSKINANEIDYIETHGTATSLGDAVEIRALHKVFKGKVSNHSIPIGSVKSNCGHLNFAAGIIGFIKAALILKKGIIPATINFKDNNEEFENDSPLFVCKNKIMLNKIDRARHVGVSSFGIGGVNAHIILEEYKEKQSVNINNKEELLFFSAKSEKSLKLNIDKNIDFLEKNNIDLERYSYTLYSGRKMFNYRSFLIVKENKVIKKAENLKVNQIDIKNEIIFIFNNSIKNYNNVILDLYNKSKIFRDYYNECTEVLKSITIKDVNLFRKNNNEFSDIKLLFLSYCLAKTLIKLNIKPDKLIGYGFGKYPLAVFSQIISIKDAIILVLARKEILNSTKSNKEKYIKLVKEIHFKSSKFNIICNNKYQISDANYWIEDINNIDNIEYITPSIQNNNILIELGNNEQPLISNINISNLDSVAVYNITDSEKINSWTNLLNTVGELWKRGINIDINNLFSTSNLKKISLPTYQFDEKEFNILSNIKYNCDSNKKNEPDAFTYKLIKKNLKFSCYDDSNLIFSDINNFERKLSSKILSNTRTIDFINIVKEKNPNFFIQDKQRIKLIFEYKDNNKLLIQLLDFLLLCPAKIDVYIINCINYYELSELSGILEYYNNLKSNINLWLINLCKTINQDYHISNEILYNNYDKNVTYLNEIRFVNEKDFRLNKIDDDTETYFLNFSQNEQVENYFKKDCLVKEIINFTKKYCPISLDENDYRYFKKKEMEQDKTDNIKRIQDYEGLELTYNKLCLCAAVNYFRKKDIEIGKYYKLEEIINIYSVKEEYIGFLSFLLDILIKNNYVSKKDQKFILIKDFDDINLLDYETQIAIENHVEFKDFICLFKHCADKYNEVFSGQKQGNAILYPNGKYDLIKEVDKNSPVTEQVLTYINLLPTVIKQILSKANDKVKILEIGGGTGRITWSVLENIKDYDIEYYFTDIGRSFIADAKKEAKSRNINNIKFKLFDIESDYISQGFYNNQFDLIIGLDVIQAVTNTKKSIQNLFNLLKENGLIIMLQTFVIQDIISMIYGFAPGWWNYQNDENRKGKSIFYTKDEWLNLYKAVGFEKLNIVEGGYNNKRNDAGIIIGSKPISNGEKINSFNNIKSIIKSNCHYIISPDFHKLIEKNQDNYILSLIKEIEDIDVVNVNITFILNKPITIDEYISNYKLISFIKDKSIVNKINWKFIFKDDDNLYRITPYIHNRYEESNVIIKDVSMTQKQDIIDVDNFTKEDNSDIVFRIIKIIEDVIGESDIKPTDDIYDIGVDSLSILIVKAKFKENFKCDLSVKEICSCNCIADIAELVKDKMNTWENEVIVKENKKAKSLEDLFNTIKK